MKFVKCSVLFVLLVHKLFTVADEAASSLTFYIRKWQIIDSEMFHKAIFADNSVAKWKLEKHFHWVETFHSICWRLAGNGILNFYLSGFFFLTSVFQYYVIKVKKTKLERKLTVLKYFLLLSPCSLYSDLAVWFGLFVWGKFGFGGC